MQIKLITRIQRLGLHYYTAMCFNVKEMLRKSLFMELSIVAKCIGKHVEMVEGQQAHPAFIHGWRTWGQKTQCRDKETAQERDNIVELRTK
jgi:hypothetical protein